MVGRLPTYCNKKSLRKLIFLKNYVHKLVLTWLNFSSIVVSYIRYFALASCFFLQQGMTRYLGTTKTCKIITYFMT